MELLTSQRNRIKAVQRYSYVHAGGSACQPRAGMRLLSNPREQRLVKEPNLAQQIYKKLHDHFGPQHWWPGDSAFEMMVGAVLTQNTSWQGAAKAIVNLKEAGVLSLDGLRSLPPKNLATLIRPAGYFNLKEQRLRNLLDMIAEGPGSLEALMAMPIQEARQDLLAVKGVGPETADSILLYAGDHPIFVIDAYTFRVMGRHGLKTQKMSYSDLQAWFMDRLPSEAQLFNEYHALLVRVAKVHCLKSQPLCEGCPLEPLL